LASWTVEKGLFLPINNLPLFFWIIVSLTQYGSVHYMQSCAYQGYTSTEKSSEFQLLMLV